jgi:hypothetical protein
MAFLSFLVMAFVCVVGATVSLPTSLPSSSTLTHLQSPTNSTSLALGQPCNPYSSQCAPGVSCYAVNSMEIPTCGSFQGTCTSTSQCATNECVNGFCSGSILPFPGSECTPLSISPSALPCAFGASCYAVNSMEITVCGNLEAECSWDGQCAYNQCQGGFCNGALLTSTSYSSTVIPTSAPSSLIYYSANSTTSTSSFPSGTGTGQVTTGVVGSTTSVLYVNGTATASNTHVTSTLVVSGTTSAAGGGDTSFRQGPSPTASVQSGGVGKAAGAAVGAIWSMGIVGMFMVMLC